MDTACRQLTGRHQLLLFCICLCAWSWNLVCVMKNNVQLLEMPVHLEQELVVIQKVYVEWAEYRV